MKRIFGILLYVIGGVIILAIAGIIIVSKKLPSGEDGVPAEALASELLKSVNHKAWESLRYVKWTFPGGRTCVWDQWYNLAEVKWGKNRVLINLNTLEGKAWASDLQLAGEDKRNHIEKAWEIWCNDSFWFNPVVKIRDDGTERELVTIDGGREGLLVTYHTGGVTPGDSYLWVMGEDGLPEYCRMWVSVLPVKGFKVMWDDWIDLEGAKVARIRSMGPLKLRFTDIAVGDHHSEIGLDRDPFADFN